MNRKKEIIQIIGSMSGKYSAYEIFSDWIRCIAMSISNSTTFIHTKIWQEREQAYMDTMRKYTESEKQKLYELTACLVDTLEEGPDDVLGKVYMESGMGSKAAGQFFTPFHVAELSARTALVDMIPSLKDEKTKLTLNEPSVGGGAMIIAAAKVLRDEGIDYQRVMEVVAQDLDWKGVYMCYVQLSLLGISAICVQGDTLANPYTKDTDKAHILITPRKAGMLI